MQEKKIPVLFKWSMNVNELKPIAKRSVSTVSSMCLGMGVLRQLDVYFRTTTSGPGKWAACARTDSLS